ncbi:MAG: MarC family protein [Gammaproteobacteria bacterium]|nr:MarC family protein [Gammaproteobacteria bacterium]
MRDVITHSISVFLAFFAVMNPIANAAVFIGLTADDDRATRRQVARKSILVAFGIILFFCVLGKALFELFGLTLPAFRITGGVLIFLIGFHMLHGRPSGIHHPSGDGADAASEDGMSVAVSPLAIPILAGPGTVATALNYSATGSIAEGLITVVSFSVLCVVTYVTFLSGDRLVRVLGRSGMEIVTRLMGLILAVVGTQMLLQGIAGAKTLF